MRCFFIVNDFIYSSRKDASSLAKRVSLLNFEPKVSKFPVIEVGATSNTSATMKSHYLFYEGSNGLMWGAECVNDFIYSSKGRQQIFGFMPKL